MSYLGNIPQIANFVKLDDISSSFNGVLTEFDATQSSTVVKIPSPRQCIISLNGVIQEPGTDFTVGSTTSKLKFLSGAPEAGDTFFAIIIGKSYDIATVSDGAVTAAKIEDGAVTSAKIENGTIVATDLAANAITNSKIIDNAVTVQKIQDNAVTPSKVSTTVNALGSVTGATTINLNDGRSVTATVTDDTTFSFTNMKATGNEDIFTLRLQNGGAHTITWPASVDWPDAGVPELTASGYDELAFKTVDCGATWVAVYALDVS